MQMVQWVRFEIGGRSGFGILEAETIHEYEGDMFNGASKTGHTLSVKNVRLLAPCLPTKMIALWNNFHALAAKLKVAEPAEPLYLLKAISCITAPGATVSRPKSYTGRISYEGELGIVIGKTCCEVEVDQIDAYIFGYTCVNDLTANDIIFQDPTFPQWARAKSFDGFGPFGPVIATDLDPSRLIVRTILDGVERQNYPISDMIFDVGRLVSMLSYDMTLFPGDLICCGTSIGLGSIKTDATTEVAIDGIGVLSNAIRLGEQLVPEVSLVLAP
jgi:2-keto-4-pentenoate hydratase/2-oxohepta-3-ene-1,7-dioic acid hydratase in catechol pathway